MNSPPRKAPTRKPPKHSTEPMWNSRLDLEQDLGALVQRSVILSQNVDEERERLMVRAPNAIEWIVRPEFCDQPSLFAHWGAYRLIKEFFELRCPVCNDGPDSVPSDPWGLSKDVLESEVLLVWSPKNEDDTCPKCGTTRSEFVDDGLFQSFRTLNAIIGQRSGKSSTLALMGTYVEHVINVIGHTYEGGLYGYLGLPQGDLLHSTFVASTDTQSKETIWAKFRGYRARAPWFKRYVPWVKIQEKLQQTPPGMQKWEYSESDKHIKNGLLGLHWDSLNSNSNGLAGRTRLASFIDEICRMEQTESSKSAQEVYRTMDASCQTVQARVDQYGLIPWLGMIGSISSPMFVDDFGMQLLEVAKRDRRMYARQMATWEFNPWEPFSAYADRLIKDRVGTMRNFGAQPPGAANPLIERPEDFFASAVDLDLKPTATISAVSFEDTTGRPMLAAQVDDAKLILRGEQRFIAADAGKNFDAFALACAHGEKDEDGNTITVFDWVVRLLTVRKNQEVYFESVYSMLQELAKHASIKVVEFDHWNSTTIVQRIRQDLGLWAEETATTNEHFIQFMRDAYSGYIRLLPPSVDEYTIDGGLIHWSKDPPFLSPTGAAIYELLKLERDPSNDKVFNSKKGLRKGFDSEDTARVLVHAHRLVQDQGYTERQDDTSRRARRKRAEVAITEWSAQGRGHIFKAPPAFGPPRQTKRGW